MKSIIQEDSHYCYICGKYIYETGDEHHIYNGSANRQKSEEDGMKVYLHRNCHSWLHEHPISNLNYKARCQKIWEETYGDREAFIKRYGKSYIDLFEEFKKGKGNATKRSNFEPFAE